MFDKGYGCVLSNCSFKEDATVIILDNALNSGNDDLYHKYAVFCDNQGYAWDEEESKRAFVECFDDEYTGCGLEGLIARVIDDAEFDGAEYFITHDDCLYVSAEVPVDDEDRQAMPTQKEIQSLLAKYLNPLLEEPATIDWLEVSD